MAEERVQRRLAAILAADVAGYSRLMGADEAGTRARFNDQLAAVVQPAIDEHRGRLVNTMGDGFLVEFGSVIDGVQCAVNIQNGVTQRQHSEPDETKMLFRIGIHLGDVIIEDDDIHGDGVNIASRLEGLAGTGDVCISASVYEQVRHKLTLPYEDMGDHSLKNIADPVHVYRLVLEQAPTPSDAAIPNEAIFRRPAVAVLPFDNLSGDPEQEYFADGLTEDIITALSLWRSFPVIARNSTFAYKSTSPDIRKVGEELGARYIVEGSVRKAGNRVRVTAQLINSETGHHVWAERYDRDLEDFFELQDEITEKIASVVAPELEKAEAQRAVSKRPENMDAWDYCQRGMAFHNVFTKEAGPKAREMFRRATELDPNFSHAWSGLGHTYQRALGRGWTEDPDKTKKELMEAAQRAVELDDSNPDAYWCLGMAHMNQGRIREALSALRRGLALNPSDPGLHSVVGDCLTLAGQHEEGVHELKISIRLNPRHPRIHLYQAHLARAHLDAGQYEEAADQARKVVERGRVYFDEYLILASALGHLGRNEEAKAVLNSLEEYKNTRISEIVVCPWWQLYPVPGPNEHLLEGLRKAGVPE
jgi:adenylate cyclase